MEELLELIAVAALAALTFLVLSAWYGLKFLGYVSLAAFSKGYRQKLKNEWRKSRWNKVLMIGGAAFYLAALGFAGPFWLSMSRSSRPSVENEFGWNDLPLTAAERQQPMNTGKFSELIGKGQELGRRMREDGRWPPVPGSNGGENPASRP